MFKKVKEDKRNAGAGNEELIQRVKKAENRLLAVVGEGTSYERALASIFELSNNCKGCVEFIVGPTFRQKHPKRLAKFLVAGIKIYEIHREPVQHFAIIDESARIEDPHVPGSKSRVNYFTQDSQVVASLYRDFAELKSIATPVIYKVKAESQTINHVQ